MTEQTSFKSFWHNRQGAIAIIFALLVIPLVVVAGMAIDYSRMSSTKETAQAHLDSAVWAAAYPTNQSPKARVMTGVNHFWAATPANLQPSVTIDMGISNNQITGTVRGIVPTTLMKVLNVESTHFTITSNAFIRTTGTPGGEEENILMNCEAENIPQGPGGTNIGGMPLNCACANCSQHPRPH